MKICNAASCRSNQFGGGYCKFHQWLRAKRSPSFPQVKAPFARIKKISKKQTQKNREKNKLAKKDHLVYQEIWEEREHVDFETGEPIYGEALTIYFHHILEKRNYRKYRHEKWNIVLVSWDTHAKAEAHCKLPKIDAYRIRLLKTKINKNDTSYK